MPASDVPAAACVGMPENAGEMVSSAVRADPAVIGAMRLDLASEAPEYHQQLREALYGDVEPTVADADAALLTSDSPVGVAMDTTTLTRDGWGSVPRTYVVCSRDVALRPRLQQKFIDDADAAFPDNPTSVVTLDSSHSPFLSMPQQVADIVTKLA
ncbi:alpha/beta fold hydrolase [Streptomyces sp. NPDC050704]|uniref:alpha/beta fold hydrolase n=1 Tax=Streptomyces sp. NPDC050704 TaxID=3157219 RepID=UPI0034176A3A